MSHLSLMLFGGFEARLDGQLITRFESVRVRALLAYLAVENGHSHTRDHLASLLWPYKPDRTAHDNLRQALANLRQAIGDKTADSPYLFISRNQIQWYNNSKYTLDTVTFTQLLATCHQHRNRYIDLCPACCAHCETAVTLYQGHFLEPFASFSPGFDEWALIQRERWQQAALDSLYKLTSHYERQSDYDQALHYATRQLELDPWREEAHLQKMRLLAFKGQRSAAMTQYVRCHNLLAQEFGVEPTGETTATYTAIRDGRLPPVTPL